MGASAATGIVDAMTTFRRKEALVDSGLCLTYAELLSRAQAIVLALKHTGISDESTAAVMCRHPSNALSVLLACVLSGRTYLPLDADTPAALVVARMRGSGALVLISDCITSQYSDDFEPPSRLDGDILLSAFIDKTDMAPSDPERWLYHLYTSGSSGTAQCIPHTWSDVTQMVRSYSDAVEVGEHDRIAMLASFGHDAAVVDIYSALLNGAALVSIDASSPLALRAAARRTADMGITIWHSVPTVLELAAGQFPPLSMNGVKVVLGGEAVRPVAVSALWKHSPEATIYRLYGQTECSVISGSWIDKDDQTPTFLGYPLNGVEWRPETPDANGVAHLWVRSPAAATHRIVNGSPHQVRAPDEWYDTGDLVERCAESFSFVGRADQVVNIAGHRVDLLEIEAYLSQVPGVLDCVALVREQPRGPAGIGCLLRSSRGEIPLVEINAFLSRHLPRRHLLTEAVTLDRPLPRTLSGKRDRRAATALLAAGQERS